MPHFHVTSARNRESIEKHGLDRTRMGAALGIAGSRRPEVDGVFVCRDRFEADWFLSFDNGDGPFDVWGVVGIDEGALLDNASGYAYLPGRIDAARLTLIDRDVVPHRPDAHQGPSSAYGSHLTITLHDGTVIEGDEATRWVADRPDR